MNSESYGSQYHEHLLEQYKLYVEMADRISGRRAVANHFFLTLHTGVLALATGLIGFLPRNDPNYLVAAISTAFGLGFALVWMRILESYRQINSAKYAMIGELEAKLPAAPYRDEWEKVGRGQNPRLYRPLTSVEAWIPRLFVVAYLAAGALAVYLLLS